MPVTLQPVRIRLTAGIPLIAYLIGKIGAGRKRPLGAEILPAGKRRATRRRGETDSPPAARFLPRLR
jgi:hypothetical protein